jgi:hypothetical protein
VCYKFSGEQFNESDKALNCKNGGCAAKHFSMNFRGFYDEESRKETSI